MNTSLLRREEETWNIKSLSVCGAEALRSGLSEVAWDILEQLHEDPMYPQQIADALDMHEQKIYYHMRNLREANLVKVVREEEKRGGTCKFYAPAAEAFAVELPGEGAHINVPAACDATLLSFFDPFLQEGTFQGTIVVGDPAPHGPFLTRAKDGHLATQIGMLIGTFSQTTTDVNVMLDTHLEEGQKDNLILVGGPITNIIAANLNDALAVNFDWEDDWKIVSDRTGNTYTNDSVGLIAKVPNPWSEKKAVVVLAGLGADGTETCVTALTQHHERILAGYKEEETFYCVVDRKDGDLLVRE